MEVNASRAIEIGISVFVFIITMTSALMLMTSVLEMSEIANRVVKDTSGSSLMEEFGEVQQRAYTSTEVLAIVNKYLNTTSNISNTIKLMINGKEVERI